MEKLQGLIEVLNKLNEHVSQCSFDKCGNTTLWVRTIAHSNKEGGCVGQCELCDKLFCWDHTDPMADVTVCQNCSGDYWRQKCQEIIEQKNIIKQICNQVEIGVTPCYDQTCNKTHYAANKADSYFVLDGSALSMEGFYLCNHCEKGYCGEHHKLLIPRHDDPNSLLCPICAHPKDVDSDVETDREEIDREEIDREEECMIDDTKTVKCYKCGNPGDLEEVRFGSRSVALWCTECLKDQPRCDNCQSFKSSVKSIYLGQGYFADWCTECQDLMAKEFGKAEGRHGPVCECPSCP